MSEWNDAIEAVEQIVKARYTANVFNAAGVWLCDTDKARVDGSLGALQQLCKDLEAMKRAEAA